MTLTEKFSIILGAKDDDEMNEAIAKLTDSQKDIIIASVVKALKSKDKDPMNAEFVAMIGKNIG